MAEDLVLKALSGDEEAATSESEDERGPTTFDDIGQAAMSQKETDGSPHNTKGGQKRKRREGHKKCNGWGAFKPVPAIDGPLQCIFVSGDCIPMWPLYSHTSTECPFIRVSERETWVLNFVRSFRKTILKGDEYTAMSQKSSKTDTRNRELARCACKSLLLEFRQALDRARKDKAIRKRISQEVLTVKMHDCEVVVLGHARTIHMRADEKAIRWIHTGFGQTVKKYIMPGPIAAMSQTAPKEKYRKHLTVNWSRVGVRDKVHWLPESCRWGLKFKGARGADTKYATEHGLTLEVPFSAEANRLRESREKAFRDACVVWNAIDLSSKARIKVCEPFYEVNIDVVPTETAMSQTDSEHEDVGLDEYNAKEDGEIIGAWGRCMQGRVHGLQTGGVL